MKHSRLLLLSCLAVGLAAAVVWWAPRRSGHATPAACLDAYYEACLTGEVGQYLGCLGEPFRTETRRRWANDGEGATTLRTAGAALKNRVQQGDGTEDGADRIIEVEEVRAPGTRRVRFRLRPSGGSWLIIGIDAGPEAPAAVPYDTHISKVPEN